MCVIDLIRQKTFLHFIVDTTYGYIALRSDARNREFEHQYKIRRRSRRHIYHFRIFCMSTLTSGNT